MCYFRKMNGRTCKKCEALLASDNPNDYCAACSVKRREEIADLRNLEESRNTERSLRAFTFGWRVYEYYFEPEPKIDTRFIRRIKNSTSVPFSEDNLEKVFAEGAFIKIESSKPKWYSPLKEKLLMTEFSKVNVKKGKSMLKFINRFGLLGFVKGRMGGLIEPLSYFKAEALRFQRYLRLCEALEKIELRPVKEFLKEHYKEIPDFLEERTKSSEETFQFGELILKRDLNEVLETVNLFIFGKFKDGLVSRYRCDKLLDVIYLQFSEKITNLKSNLIRCRGCNSLFFPGRANQEYCSKRCRGAARLRRFRARQRV